MKAFPDFNDNIFSTFFSLFKTPLARSYDDYVAKSCQFWLFNLDEAIDTKTDKLGQCCPFYLNV